MFQAEHFKAGAGNTDAATSSSFHDEWHKLNSVHQLAAEPALMTDVTAGPSLQFTSDLYDRTRSSSKSSGASGVKSDESFQLQVKLMALSNDNLHPDVPQQLPQGQTDVFPSGGAKADSTDWAQKLLDKLQADKNFDDLAQQIKIQHILWDMAHPGSQYAPRDSHNDSNNQFDRGKNGHDSHEHKEEHGKKTESQWEKDCQEFLNKFYKFVLGPIVALEHLDGTCAKFGRDFCDTVKELADYIMDCAKHGTKPTEKMIDRYITDLGKQADRIGKELKDRNFGALLHELITHVGDSFKDLGNPLDRLGHLAKAAQLAQKIGHYHHTHSNDRGFQTAHNVLPVVELYEELKDS